MNNVTMAFEKCSAIARRGRLGRLIGAPIRFPRSLVRKYHSSSCGPNLHRTHLFWGASMEVLYPELISVHVDRYGFFEEGLTAFALRHLRPGMTVLDIGGHFGYFSRLAEFLTSDGGSVHTFEPTPSTFQVLKRNTEEFLAITLNQAAVADQPGTLQLTDYGTAYAAFNTVATGKLEAEVSALGITPSRFVVETLTVDDYVRSHDLTPAFVKIDAEGAETLILAGMQQTISAFHPMISMEVGDREDVRSAACIRQLVSAGYSILKYHMTDRSFRRITPDDDYSHDNLFFIFNGELC